MPADTLPVRKPDPAPYRLSVERAGGRVERSILIGDTETDRKTGLAAGVPVALVTFGPEGQGVARLAPEALLASPLVVSPVLVTASPVLVLLVLPTSAPVTGPLVAAPVPGTGASPLLAGPAAPLVLPVPLVSPAVGLSCRLTSR